ncbi:MAG: DUF424 domain-containing protein [Candidatus Bathyarchaeia archaeon]
MRGFWVKVTRHGKHLMVAACDEDMIGMRIEDGDFCVKVQEGFYMGEKLGSQEAIEIIRRGTIINLIGNEIVDLAVSHKLVHPDAVIRIGKIAHAQIVHIL